MLAAVSNLPWAWNLLGLLAIPALVALNGFFVAVEFALVALRKTRVEEMVRQGVRGARAVEDALVTLDRSLAATQFGITLASIALGMIGEPTLHRLLNPLFATLPDSWRGFVTHSAAATVALMLITFMHVVFGELIPRSVALQTPDRTSLWLAGPLGVFARLSRPITLIFSGTANAVLRWCGYQALSSEEMVHSVAELSLLIEDTEEAGILEPDQAMYVQNLFLLSDKEVKDCMVPADKMASLEVHTPPDKVLDLVRTGAHTRLPVYDGALDNIVGIVNTKDLFYLFSVQGVVVLEDALYPALFLKPDETVATALRLFKQAKRHMALVRDEEGKVHGLITLENVLEEIVGDIEDEHDRPTPRAKLRPRRSVPATVKREVPSPTKKDIPVPRS